MAINFDLASLGSMFGQGGAPTGIDALLNDEQRKLMGRNANLSAAAALLAASGRSPQRISLGQALGSALQAGQQGYQQARAGSLQDLLLGEKLKEAQTARQVQQQVAGALTAQPSVLTPEQQALAAPGGQVGPTMQRAEMAAAMPQMTPNQIKATQYQNAADILAAAGRVTDAEKYQSMAEKLNPRAEVVGQPFEVTDATGKPILVQQFKDGKLQTAAGFGPKREVVLQNFGGQTVAVDKSALRGGETFQQTMTPGEVASNQVALGNLAVSRGQLGVAQGGLNLRQQEFARGGYQIKEGPDGMMYVPSTPGGTTIPVMTAAGTPFEGAGAKPTEDQSKSAGFAFRMEQASKIFAQPALDKAGNPMLDPKTGKPITLEQAYGQPNKYQSIMRAIPSAGLTTGIANLSEDVGRQQYRQAQENWVSANLRPESGAVLGTEEIQKEIIKYFPQTSDDAQTIAQKAKARRDTELAVKVRAGPAFKQMQKAAAQAEAAAPSMQQPAPGAATANMIPGAPVWDPVKKQYVYQ
jgi:hypothetical protein